MTMEHQPIDEVPEQDREEVAPEKIRVGDYVYDPKWRRWLKVAHVALSTGGTVTSVPPWHFEKIREEWTFYYFAEEDWARGTGAREDRLVTRQTRAAQNRANAKNTRASIYKPSPPRHPNGPANGFPRQDQYPGRQR